MFPDEFLFGLNAGGSAFIDENGNLYEADVTGEGNSYATGSAISGTIDDALYQSESWSPDGLSYEVAVAAGTYYVELNFAEIYFTAPDAREFDIFLENTLVFDNLDIYAESGGKNVAYTVGFYVEVTDGSLSLDLSPEIENPKISGFSVWSVTEDPIVDETAPLVAIDVSGGTAANNPVQVVVTYSDETALDAATITLDDLVISGAGTYTIQSQTLNFAPDGLSATATYSITQDGGWTLDPVAFDVAAGAIADTSANGNVATGDSFTFTPPPPDTDAPDVVIDVSGGTAATNPVQVVVTYSDETALDAATITLDDLVISGAGAYTIQSQVLSVAPDNTSATATYVILQEGGWSGDPVSFDLAADAFADGEGNGNVATGVTAIYGHPFAGIAAVDTYDAGAAGKVSLSVTAGSGVQSSTYGSDAFQISNLGDKRVAAIYIDIEDALLSDAVFDPLGLAGDDVARGVVYSNTGATGAQIYDGAALLTPFYGAGGIAGYHGLMITFDPDTDTGFQTGETAAFGVDIDPNSIADIPANTMDINGADPRLASWDIGGVSGAELTGASVQVLFTDGTIATTQLIGDGSQGGAMAMADQSVAAGMETELSVNGTPEGGSGTWGADNTVIIEGPAGETARVVMVIGFSQPFDYVAPDGNLISTYDRLIASGDAFLANNALEVQTIDVVLTGAPQDITSLFDFTAPGGALVFPGDGQLPLAFASSLIDGAGNPVGTVSAPIYLQSDAPPGDTVPPGVSLSVTPAESAIAPIVVTVIYSDETGLNPATLDLSDLIATADGTPLEVLWSNLDVAANGLSATATYGLMPADGDWTGKTADLSLAAGAATDLAGNPTPAVTDSFTFTEDPEAPSVDSLAEMTQLALQGVNLTNPTSIDVGADGRLYVSQQNGLIVALTIEKTTVPGPGGIPITTWSVSDREDITLIQDMPNHSDTGVYQPGVVNRQVTGVLTTTDEAGNVVIYVSSSDPRIGGGGSGDDKDLDTNSGILSRLTQAPDGSWEKLDLVRGLPRSEENHANNGMELITDENGNEVIVLTVGGFTNTGAQSNNFAYTSEYFYSASVVTIDLAALQDMEDAGQISTYTPPGTSEAHDYLYDLPTLDDITRTNDAGGGDLAGDGSVTADVFGGNNGLNQAIYDPNGIVEVVYSGFRNHYDIVVTPAGEVYTVDNGSNAGWGGITVNAAGEEVVDLNGDGLADNGPALNLANNNGDDNADSLLRLDDNIWTADTSMYYGGHPNLYRAYGADAGVYLYADSTNPWGVAAGTPLDFVAGALTPTTDPVDLAPLIPNANLISGVDEFGQPLIDPQQAVQLGTGTRDEGLTDTPNGALYTFFSSTNGLDIYTGQGDLQGELITVSFNGKIYALEIGADGSVVDVEERALTSSPLDVVTQGAYDPYPGVIFVAAYGADQIVILSPDESAGVTPNPNDRDEDGIDDTIDPFAADPDNGLVDLIVADQVLHWSFVNGEAFPNDRESIFDGTGGLYNGGDIGFTGIMTSRGGLPESLYVQDNIIFGGAPGVLQVKQVDSGDATTDTQRNGFQLGTSVDDGVTSFTVSSAIDNYLDDIGGVPADEKLAQGIYIGAGDQNNFVSVSLVRLADGQTGFEVVSQFAFDFIGETPPQIDFYAVPELASAGALDTLVLYLDVDMATTSVTPRWEYDLSGVPGSGSGAAVTLMGDALKALQGTLTLPDDSGGQVATGLAVGVVSSRSGSAGGDPVTIAAISAGGDETLTTTIDGVEVTFIPDTDATNVTITGESKTYGGKESTDIAGTDLDELHTEERYAKSGADWGYDIATGNGTFQVDLYFAEIWGGGQSNGARVFDVLVEDQIVSDNLDIYALAGGNSELIVSVQATVVDGVLDIDFDSFIQNAKVNAVLVRDMNAIEGDFAADWDYLNIEGFGTPPVDETAPLVAIGVSGGVIADDPVTVTVSYSDEIALDATTLALGDLVITGPGDYTILSENLSVAPDGKTATATYIVLQDGGWTIDPVAFDVAAGAIADTSANPNAAASESFTYIPPGTDVTAPLVALDVTGGTTAADPAEVVVTYTDETALDAATIALDDLVISGAGTYTIQSQTLNFAPDGLSATATYSITQDGGWTIDPVAFDVAAGAIADAAGNPNAAASDGFTFVPPDLSAPSVAVAVTGGGTTASDPLAITVTYADETALDAATIALDDLVISGAGTYTIQSQTLNFAPDGLSATATYSITQDGGWTTDPVAFDVAAGAIADAAGNPNAAASDGFTFVPPPDLTSPVVAIDVTAATDPNDPVSVTVTYTDETALDAATIALDDLVITGAGTYTIQSQDLVIAPDGLSATATYSITQDGGWTADPVAFDVAAGAITDTSANPNAAASDGFTFDDPGDDVFVFALNAGGGEYTDAEGTVFAADTYGVGSSYSVTKAIAGTQDDALFQSETYGDGTFTYDIAMANGTYRIDLFFAEIYRPINEVGERVFDIYLEDVLVLDDLDVVSETGARWSAYETSALVTVSDGSLTLTGVGEIENPKINAFSVWTDGDMIA